MENIIIQGILFSSEEIIQPTDVGIRTTPRSVGLGDETLQGLPYKTAKEKTLQHFNLAYIGHLLAINNGNVTQAAHAGGMERQALQQIMRRYGIDADKYRP